MKRYLSGLVLSGLIVAAVLGGGSAGVSPAEAATGHTSTVTAKTIKSASAKRIFKGGLFVQPDSEAAVAAGYLTDPAQKKAAKYIAKRSVAIWLGDWQDGDVLTSYIKRNLEVAEKDGTTPVFVTYALPDRDCGGHSAGGFTAAHYLKWNKLVAKTLKGHRAVVLVEPDSLAIVDQCPAGTEAKRLPLLKKAVTALKKAAIPAYLDGATSTSIDVNVMAKRLKKAGIASARGFFTNVANYRETGAEKSYAARLSKLVGNAHYVIDVSRNAKGYTGDWCNAVGAGLGKDPKVIGRKSKLDALLWVKTPGASDGECNGGPAAGQWFGSYAAELVRLRAK